jgi:hypothetical protein
VSGSPSSANASALCGQTGQPVCCQPPSDVPLRTRWAAGQSVHVAQHLERGRVGHPQLGHVDDYRLGLAGEHVEQRGTHGWGRRGVEHPGQTDQRIRVSAVNQVSDLARHDRSIVHNVSPIRISASGGYGHFPGEAWVVRDISAR